MRFGGKTALGIDISDGRVSMALVRRGKTGLELVRSVWAQLPDGAVKDGNIEDAALLSKTIRELKSQGKIRASRAAVSLFANPAIVQIIDMPKPPPANIRQFVQSEVKHYVALPGKDLGLDFCGVGGGKRLGEKRVLAVATDNQRMTAISRVFGQAGIEVALIEPPLLSYIRAIRAKKIEGKTGCNVLVVMLRGSVLTLCVLRNQAMDFVRTKEIVAEFVDPTLLPAFLADEMGQIVQFYDVEVAASSGKWEAVVFVDTTLRLNSGQAISPRVGSAQMPEGLDSFLKSRLPNMAIEVRTIEDAYMDTPLVGSPAGNDNGPSPVAIGLAMELLKAQQDEVKINMVPSQIVRIREAKKDALIAANAVAALFLIMVLAVDLPAWMAERLSSDTASKRMLIEGRDTEERSEQHRQFDARIGVLSSRLDRIGQISTSHHDVNWVEALNDIRKATPRSVRINAISCQDGSRMLIEGLAMSNEAINLFVNSLEKSQSISSVVVLETWERDGQSGLITYQVSCKLRIGSAKTDNVG
jgi:hypothetical protein